MVRRMKGPSGTKVKITVKRDRDIIPFEITRDKIPMHSVDAAFMVDDTTGYLRLSSFSRTTNTEVISRVMQMPDMKRLILDLRSNTGGYFDQALLLSNLFLEKGSPIVYMEGRNRRREEYKADGKGLLKDIALTVLVDEGSASSSEIVAGAIQDNDRGLLSAAALSAKVLCRSRSILPMEADFALPLRATTPHPAAAYKSLTGA